MSCFSEDIDLYEGIVPDDNVLSEEFFAELPETEEESGGEDHPETGEIHEES